MSHLAYVEDESGDLVDLTWYCSDSCHRQGEGDAYRGWNGCHESEFNTYCSHCGVIIGGSSEDDCGHIYPTVVNLIGIPEDDHCEHGILIRAAVR